MTQRPHDTPRPDAQTQDLLARAMATVDGLRAQLDRRRATDREPIAITGLGCRFPGAAGPEAFANMLERGDISLASISERRRQEGSGPQSQTYARGGFFEDITGFDPQAFGVSDAEAMAMDPHLRLLLEVTREAIEDAGLSVSDLAGSRTGVILALGAQNSEYATALMAKASGAPEQATGISGKNAITGSFHSLMPGQISYHFDLRGPSYVVDAACASSLVAVEQACHMLRRRDCERVIVAGVNLVISDAVSRLVDQAGLWSARGQSLSFDAEADGFVRGEGASALVLTLVSVAQKAAAPIRSLVHGAASGQDGRGNGIAAPNAPAQTVILRRAIEQAALPAHQVAYVEAHATGTKLGDAIEAEAVAEIYGRAKGRNAPVVLGALKPVLGHLEAASGMAALVRVILARQAGRLPRAAQPKTLNPEVAALSDLVTAQRPLDDKRQRDWPDDAPYAGVSAFGMSGTNAHIVIGPPPMQPDHATDRMQDQGADQKAAPVSYIRRRFWPDAMVPNPPFAETQDPVDLRDLFRVPRWSGAQLGGLRLPADVLLAGDAALRARIGPVLSALGVSQNDLALDKDVTGHLIYCLGSGFADLVRLQRLLPRLLVDTGSPRLTVICDNANGRNVAAAAAMGLIRAIGLEHPELRPRLVDVTRLNPLPQTAMAEACFAQIPAPILRLSPNGVEVQDLAQIDFPPTAFAPDEHGSHLITGGFGGIGATLALWLAERGARHILLVGRNPRPHPDADKLEALGVTVTAIGADVADRTQMANLFETAEAGGHPVKSVFHAAGTEENALLAQQSAESFAAAFRAKLLGASVLDALTQSLDLQAFVMLSSVTAFLPLTGAGAYAAANASLGAIAQARRAAGLPALCLYSGTWAGSGMVARADATLAQQWCAHGLSTMSRTLALAGLDAALHGALNSGACECVMARVDWDKARAVGDLSEVPPKAQIVEPSRAVDKMDQSLDDMVRASVAKVLGMSVNDARLSAPFAELGVTSLAAIALRNDLSQCLRLRLPATLAFNYPSVDALTAALRLRLTESRRAEKIGTVND